MESSHLEQTDKSSPETFTDSSQSSDLPDTNDIFGDPSIHPRVGEEYQAKIPSILSDSEFIHMMLDCSRSFLTGLPIPVTWVRIQENPIKTERLEYHDDPHEVHTNDVVGPENIETIEVDSTKRTSASTVNWLVPGQATETWSDFEAECFLLGLYLLGKNLAQVKRFMESKGMGQILAYYYGRFYASPGYSKWSECRKMRNRKCVIGHKFFTGYRQQELFSRVFPRISEESKTKLLEASRAFADGTSSLDDYVFTLKELVGIIALVDAVGIGKGKEDLTTLVFDGPKNNQILSHRPEVPSGKAWSSLTCGEIVKYLTGDFRLSKARSNDLFWEAVWPRLLARGWNSLQPKGDGYKGSKHLVFLMPGIKKFSRKLSKGDHFFDSVSDVLAKVASEPQLLELEADETTPSCSKVENGWNLAADLKTDDDQDSSDHERRCYLKPRVSLGRCDDTKFTIVDTSLANEDNPYKVVELRCLPVEVTSSHTFSSQMRKKNKKKSQVNGNVLPNGSLNLTKKLDDTSLPVEHKSRTIKHQFTRRVKPGLSSCEGSVAKRRRFSSGIEAHVPCVLCLPARSKSAVPRTVPRTVLRIVGPKLSQTDVKLASDKNAVDYPIESSPETEKLSIAQHPVDLNFPRAPVAPPECDVKVKLEEEVSTSTPIVNVEKTKHFDPEIPASSNAANPEQFAAEKQKSLEGNDNLPDLMATQVSSTSGEPSNEVVQHVAEKHKISEEIVGPSVSSVLADSPNKAGIKLDKQPRRQSTRNRPLTTKALEALEIGLLTPVRTYKKRSASLAQGEKPKRVRPSRKTSPMLPHDLGVEVSASD